MSSLGSNLANLYNYYNMSSIYSFIFETMLQVLLLFVKVSKRSRTL